MRKMIGISFRINSEIDPRLLRGEDVKYSAGIIPDPYRLTPLNQLEKIPHKIPPVQRLK